MRTLAVIVMLALGSLSAGSHFANDVTLDAGSVWSKLKTFRRDPWQLGPLNDEGLQVLRFALLTIALSLWAQQMQRN